MGFTTDYQQKDWGTAAEEARYHIHIGRPQASKKPKLNTDTALRRETRTENTYQTAGGRSSTI